MGKSALLMVFLSVLSVGTVCAQVPPNAPGPFATGNGDSYSPTDPWRAGDPHGSIGRTFIVLKSNDHFIFLDRSKLNTSGYNPPPSPGAPNYILDRNFWDSSISSSQLIRPGESALPSETIRIVPEGDGRVFYDPESTCSDGGGRWYASELVSLFYPDGSIHGGIGIAASTGEAPYNSSTQALTPWNRFYIGGDGSARCSNPICRHWALATR